MNTNNKIGSYSKCMFIQTERAISKLEDIHTTVAEGDNMDIEDENTFDLNSIGVGFNSSSNYNSMAVMTSASQ